MRREEHILILLCAIILGLFAFRLYIENMQSIQGDRLYNLQQLAMDLRRQNIELQDKILHLSSFTYIGQTAKKQGYMPSRNELNL